MIKTGTPPAKLEAIPAFGPAGKAYYTFRAGAGLYGIDVAALREVSAHLAITPVPHAPPAIRGLANLRSRILMVLDLRPLLHLPPADCTEASRLMILKPAVLDDAGVLVDGGGDIIQVRDEQIEWIDDSAHASSAQLSSRLVAGVCKLEKELMMIIDASRFGDVIASLMK